MNEQELMQKLALSKAIMDKSEKIKSPSQGGLPQSMVEQFDVPQAKYNIPEGMLESTQQPYLSQPTYNSNPTKPLQAPTIDSIKNSKLPDEIKRLMIEHPIAQPQQQSNTSILSDELIQKASRLMGNTKSDYVSEQVKKEPKKTEKQSSTNISQVQSMIEEAVNKALKENGLLVESTEKSNETFSFRVGKHIFEGKVTKIKKVS